MKKINFFILLFCLISSNIFAQSAILEKFSDAEKDYKYKTFEIVSVNNSKISKKEIQELNNNIKIAFFSEKTTINDKEISTISLSNTEILKSYTALVKQSLKEQEIHLGTTDISYLIGYNKDYILSFMVRTEYMGAYPSTHLTYFNFSLHKGKRITEDDIFISAKKKQEFKNKMKEKIKTRVKKKIKELEPEMAQELNSKEINLDNLTFNITQKGITFFHDFQLPHVMKAIEPDTDYEFSWQELSTFIKKEQNLFAPFYKK